MAGGGAGKSAAPPTGRDHSSAPSPCAIDPSGSIVAGGAGFEPGGQEPVLTVVKVGGLLGSERWRWSDDFTVVCQEGRIPLLIDSGGDVIVAANRSGLNGITVVKLDGATGALVWQVDYADGFTWLSLQVRLAITAAGDPVIGFQTTSPASAGFKSVRIPSPARASMSALRARSTGSKVSRRRRSGAGLTALSSRSEPG